MRKTATMRNTAMDETVMVEVLSKVVFLKE